MSYDAHRFVEPATVRSAVTREALLVRFQDRLTAFVRSNFHDVLRAHESPSDVVQSVCREVLAGKPEEWEYRGEEAFIAWLLVTAKRKMKAKVRYWNAAKRCSAREVPVDAQDVDRLVVPLGNSSSGTPSEQIRVQEAALGIAKALDDMRPDWRKVIIFSRFHGYTHAEIAKIMGRTPVAVRALLKRAWAHFSKELVPGPH